MNPWAFVFKKFDSCKTKTSAHGSVVYLNCMMSKPFLFVHKVYFKGLSPKLKINMEDKTKNILIRFLISAIENPAVSAAIFVEAGTQPIAQSMLGV